MNYMQTKTIEERQAIAKKSCETRARNKAIKEAARDRVLSLEETCAKIPRLIFLQSGEELLAPAIFEIHKYQHNDVALMQKKARLLTDENIQNFEFPAQQCKSSATYSTMRNLFYF